MSRTTIFQICAIVTVLWLATPIFAKSPALYGVTEGSVYKEFVRLYWFETGGVATLSKDGADAVVIQNTKEISENGSYIVELSVTKENETVSNKINFSIDTASDAHLITHPDPSVTKLSIKMEPDTYKGNPMMVVWSEDMNGNFLQNLHVSSAAATNYMRFTNNIVKRPQALPYWMHKTCPVSAGVYLADPTIPLPKGLDAVSGATQKNGFTLETHVLTPAVDKKIRIFLEINQSFDSGWYFHKDGPIREETDGVSTTTFGADSYFNGSEEPSIVYMIEVPVDQPGIYRTAEPVGYGHYGGRTGTLYTDFYALDGDIQRHKFDHAINMVGEISVTVHNLEGDITGDCEVGLSDAIRGLQICAGKPVACNINGDVDGNRQLGVEEAIFVLEHIAN